MEKKEYTYSVKKNLSLGGYDADVIEASSSGERVLVKFYNCPTEEKATERAQWYISRL